MARDPEITVRVNGDASGAQAALGKTEAAVVGFSAAAGTALANYADRAARALVDVGRFMLDQASQAQQAQGAVEAVFGDQAAAVEGYAKRAADAVGMSAAAYSQLASVLGSQLKNAGVPIEQVADKTNELVQRGADLASVFGTDVNSAVSAISSLMRGERDPIEAYGVTINQAAIDAWKLANGLDGATGAAKTAADQQAALALLFEQTGYAAGNFAAEADTFAGAQERLNAKWADAAAELGTALIPFMTLAAQALGVFADFAKENSTAVTILVGVFAALAAAVWLVNIAMAANPIGLIIIAVGLLIAIIVVLIANWDQVVAAFENGAQQIAGFFTWLGDNIAAKWNVLIDGITNAWESFVGWFGDTIDNIVGWIQDAINWFNDLFGAASKANGAANNARTAPAAASAFAAPMARSALFVQEAAAPVVTTAAARNVASASLRARMRDEDARGGDTFIINGALDPNAVAKQISRLQRGREARIGLGAAAGVRA